MLERVTEQARYLGAWVIQFTLSVQALNLVDIELKRRLLTILIDEKPTEVVEVLDHYLFKTNFIFG
jgi:hypothetical protein